MANVVSVSSMWIGSLAPPRASRAASWSVGSSSQASVAQNGRIIRLGDIARVTRGPADPAQPMFRVNGRDGIGLAIAMRTGGDVLALGRNIEQAMTEITA